MRARYTRDKWPNDASTMPRGHTGADRTAVLVAYSAQRSDARRPSAQVRRDRSLTGSNFGAGGDDEMGGMGGMGGFPFGGMGGFSPMGGGTRTCACVCSCVLCVVRVYLALRVR
jgi:hypothetical protein